MKKYPYLLILIVAALLIGGVLIWQRYYQKPQLPSPQISKDGTENWKTYSNSQLGFSFKYPDNYSFITPPDIHDLSWIYPYMNGDSIPKEWDVRELVLQDQYQARINRPQVPASPPADPSIICYASTDPIENAIVPTPEQLNRKATLNPNYPTQNAISYINPATYSTQIYVLQNSGTRCWLIANMDDTSAQPQLDSTIQAIFNTFRWNLPGN